MSDDDLDNGRAWADEIRRGLADRVRMRRPQPKPRPAQPEREGWKKPMGHREAPHPVWVELERHRVICRQCPWFLERIGADYQWLKAAGQRHRARMREIEQEEQS